MHIYNVLEFALSLQKVVALTPKVRPARDVGQECSCPPGTCVSVP